MNRIDICCGHRFITFIDNQYQCYWSPSDDNEESKDIDDINKQLIALNHFSIDKVDEIVVIYP